MNKELITNRLKELIDFYQKQEEIEAIYLTSYLENGYKIFELNLLADNLDINTRDSFNVEEKYQIIISSIAKKDLELKYDNERTLVKLLNSLIFYDKTNKLTEFQKKINRIADNEPLVTMYSEITFYEVPEITNRLGK